MSVSSFTPAAHFPFTWENARVFSIPVPEKTGGRRSSYVTQIGEKILTRGYERKTVSAGVQERSLLRHDAMKLLWTIINYFENQLPSFTGQKCGALPLVQRQEAWLSPRFA
jgi:hypothetical protein